MEHRQHVKGRRLPQLPGGALVGGCLLLIIALGGQAAQGVRALAEPIQGLVDKAIRESPQSTSIFNLFASQQTMETGLRYTEALVEALLDSEDPPPPQFQQLAALVGQAKDGISLDSFSFDGEDLLVFAKAPGEESALNFVQSVRQANLFPQVEMEGEPGEGGYCFTLRCGR